MVSKMREMSRPHIIINCAMSADGKIALPTGKQMRISSDEDMKRMYHLRNNCDAVLVGSGAVLSDDPKLTVKEKYVESVNQPIRIVLDSQCKTPVNALVVDEKSRTIIFTDIRYQCDKKYKNNVEIIPVNKDENGYLDLYEILNILNKKGIHSLLVEGGGTIIWNFIQSSLVDDLYVYIAPMIIGGKQTPTMVDGRGINDMKNIIQLRIIDIKKIGEGMLVHYKIKM
jgi:2,5-diamino-6-(ribosylamino)-4(3H)-pyrimidinone 5'-phosphate reductase